MQVSRWEKERAAWLLARSRPGSLRRRRAELLARRARQLGRAGSGVGESSLHDDASESLFHRLLKSDEGSVDKLARVLLVPVAFAVVWVLAGCALLISTSIYRVLWTRSPQTGRLLWWPWVVAGLGVGALWMLLVDHGGVVDVSVWPRYPVIDVDWGRGIGLWVWDQLCVGLVLTGLRIRGEGWPAVPADAVAKPDKYADGTFREVPEPERVHLDPLAGATDPEDTDQRDESPSRPAQATSLVSLSAFIATDEPEDDEPAPFPEIDIDDDPFADAEDDYTSHREP